MHLCLLAVLPNKRRWPQACECTLCCSQRQPSHAVVAPQHAPPLQNDTAHCRSVPICSIMAPRLLQPRLLIAALLLLAAGRPAGAQEAEGGARLLQAGTPRRADAIRIGGPPARCARRRRRRCLLPPLTVDAMCCSIHQHPDHAPQVPACRNGAQQRLRSASVAAGHGEWPEAWTSRLATWAALPTEAACPSHPQTQYAHPALSVNHRTRCGCGCGWSNLKAAATAAPPHSGGWPAGTAGSCWTQRK